MSSMMPITRQPIYSCYSFVPYFLLGNSDCDCAIVQLKKKGIILKLEEREMK